MNITPDSIPSPTAPRRLGPRWILATLVVAVVFVGGRVTVADAPADSARAGDGPAPKTGWTSPADPGTSESQNDGRDPDTSGPSTGVLDAATETFTGRGANGGTWTMNFPSDWIVHDDAGLTSLDSPGRPNVAMVATRPYVGPLEDETARDLGQLSDRLEDLNLIDLQATTVAGRPAAQAQLEYTTPAGEAALVSITWIRDDGSLYLIAGEAPIDDPALGKAVTQVLDSFVLTETA